MSKLQTLLENYLKNEFEKELPKSLQEHEKKIKETVMPFIELQVSKDETSLWDSKFGGLPYMPLDFTYPVNENGVPLHLLAQINFEEMPELEPFPNKGILQFFFNPYDDLLGLDFDNQTKQNDFRVIYHEEVVKNVAKLQQNFDFIIQPDEENYTPISHPCKITGHISFSPISYSDYKFEEVVGEEIIEIIDQDDEAGEFFGVAGHKIGGFPFFTQCDPRDKKDFDVMLIQVDSEWGNDKDFEIMWGDAGVGNFFISSEDLKNLNFTNVLYNWDCH